MFDEAKFCFYLSYNAEEAKSLPTQIVTPGGLEVKIDLGHIRGCLFQNDILVWFILTTEGWKVLKHT